MQESLHLAEGEQCRLLGRGLGEIRHHAHVRPYVLALMVDGLLLEFRHPGTVVLTLAWVEVGVEDGEIAAVLVKDLIGLDVGMIDGDVLVFLECDAIEAMCQTEDAVDDLVELEVRTQHLRVDIVVLNLQLMGIV